MPAVMIRQLGALMTIMEQTTDAQRTKVLMEQAEMIYGANAQSVPEASDGADADRRCAALEALHGSLTA